MKWDTGPLLKASNGEVLEVFKSGNTDILDWPIMVFSMVTGEGLTHFLINQID